MKYSHFILFVLLHITVVATSNRKHPETCLNQLSKTKNIFEVLPGSGWDNLRNTDEYRVIDISYNKCQMTADQIFLIPDEFNVEPIKASKIESFADTFNSFQSFTSATSASINAEFSASESGFFGREKAQISGSFSLDAQFTMKKQLETNSSLLRVSARYPRYRITMKPDTRLDPAFRKRLQKIAALVETKQDPLAMFEAQLLVRDFGTHVLSNILVGGMLVKEDFISQNSSSSNINFNIDGKLRYQAGESFNAFFFKESARESLGIDVSNSETSTKTYFHRLEHSQVSTYGGPLFKTGNFSIDQWENGLESNLVAIDRSGSSIFNFINPYTLPEIQPETVYKLENLAMMAVQGYYTQNTIYGCTDPNFVNFNSNANVDDGTCGISGENYLIGGFYQKCSEEVAYFCDGFSFVNPRTDNYSCPSGFTSILLWKGRKSYDAICRRINCLNWNSEFVNEYTVLEYSAYWCAPHGSQPSESPGFLFGGFWNPSYQNNPITGGNYCPNGFSQSNLGIDLLLCYADDIGEHRLISIPFGGFFSSTAGNPLIKNNVGNNPPSFTSEYDKKCPPKFTKHLVSVDENTEIYYCGVTKQSKNFETRNAVRPPFMKRPLIKPYDLANAIIKMTEMEAATIKLTSLEESDTRLTSLQKASYKYLQLSQGFEKSVNLTQSDDLIKNTDKSNYQQNTIVAVIAVVSVGTLVIVLVLVTIYVRKRKGRQEEYINISSNDNNSVTEY